MDNSPTHHPPTSHRPSSGAAGIVLTSAVLLVAAFCFTPIGKSVLTQTENASDDTLTHIGKSLPPSEQIVVLEVPTQAVESSDPALAMFNDGPPWSRSIFAKAVNRIGDAGASAIGLNIMTSRPSTTDPDGDVALAAAASARPNIVTFGAELTADQPAVLSGGHGILAVPHDIILPPVSPPSQIGVTTTTADRVDGITRHVRYLFPVDDSYASRKSTTDIPVWPSMAANLARPNAPTADRRVRIRWTTNTPTDTPDEYTPFPTIPLEEIFTPALWSGKFENGAFFNGKTVLITTPGNQQSAATPQGTTSSAQIQLCALNAALTDSGGIIKELPQFWSNLPFILGTLAALTLFFTIRRPLVRGAAAMAVGALLLTVIWLMFNHLNILIPSGGMILSLLMVTSAGVFTDIAEKKAAKEELVQSLTRQTSLKLTQKISSNPGTYLDSLVGARRPMTLLTVNLKDFADTVEPRTPSSGVHQLNEYLESITHCVFENDGTTSSAPCDSLLASWGSLRKEDPAISAPRALEAARQMRRELDKLNSQWKRQKQPPLKQGIALHFGECIVGQIGPNNQRQLNIVGRTTSTVRQLEALTHKFGSEIIISDAIAKWIPEDVQPMLRPLPYLQMRGNPKALTLYDVIRSDKVAHWETYKADYTSGLEAFTNGDFESAVRRFDRCRSASPSDGLVTTMLEGAQGFVTRAPRKWKGVISLDNR